MKTTLPLLGLLATLAACTHPLEIVGEGDILSASGDHDCLLENQPCKVEAVDAYRETYFPQPRPGHEFVDWENCLFRDGDSCVFDVPADAVQKNWGETMPALIAKFAPACPDAPADTFTAIQTVIFEGKGCTGSACHDSRGPQAGMNLTAGNAYANIVDVEAQSGGGLKRILPGDADNSFLYRKVAAKTSPGSFRVAGSPMPLVGSALSTAQLAALAAWIDAGAPQTGRAGELREVEQLLGLCGETAPDTLVTIDPPPVTTGPSGGGYYD